MNQLQRQCACGGTLGPTGECALCRRKRLLAQPKLTVGPPGDRYEQEADRVAEQVVRMPDPALQRQPLEEEEELLQPTRTLQRQAGADEGAAAPPLVHDVLRSPGHPLDEATRAFMEPRFGHDFSRVRVHADSRASASAHSVGARAYTVERNVVFGTGQYAPGTAAGRRLLAHELTHVVQQRHAFPAQRLLRTPEDEQPAPESPVTELPEAPLEAEPEAKAEPEVEAEAVNVAMYMDSFYRPAADLLAAGGKVYKISSPAEMAAKLKDIDFSIRNLAVVSHSSDTAKIKFEDGGWVDPGTLAMILRGSLQSDLAPALLDFRGCSLGMSPEGMEKLRSAVGAGAAVGSNCFIATWVTNPVKIGLKGQEKPITERSQLKKSGYKALFKELLKNEIDNLGDKKKCILDTSEDAYFQAKGKLVSMFANQAFSKFYVEGTSICYNDLQEVTVDPAKAAGGDVGAASRCKLIRVEQSSPADSAEDAAPAPESAPTPEPAPAEPAP